MCKVIPNTKSGQGDYLAVVNCQSQNADFDEIWWRLFGLTQEELDSLWIRKC